jgi:hypothetical protein
MSDQLVAVAATYTTQNKQKIRTAGFAPATQVIKRMQTHTVDRTATAISYHRNVRSCNYTCFFVIIRKTVSRRGQ